MPTLKEIQEKLGNNYVARLEYNLEAKSDVLMLFDKAVTRHIAIGFKDQEIDIEEYWDKVLLPMKLALDKSNL